MLPSGLPRAVEKLEAAERILREVYSIGVWTSSDDCSFNRNRRRLVREARSEVADAGDALASLPSRNAMFEEDVRTLVAFLERIPDTVPDTMADRDPVFDSVISDAISRVESLLERCRELSSAD